MDLTIAGVLTVDGLTNGAVYALLGMGIVLLFSVTRIIFIPQGEFVAYGALTLAIFQTGQVPGTVWLLFIVAAVRAALLTGLPALVVGLLGLWAAPHNFPLVVQALLSLAIVTAYGPLIYRVAYQSLAGASTLVLLIISVGVHFAMTGLGLLFFGAEGFRNPSFWDARLDLGPLSLSGHHAADVWPLPAAGHPGLGAGAVLPDGQPGCAGQVRRHSGRAGADPAGHRFGPVAPVLRPGLGAGAGRLYRRGAPA